MSAVQPVLKAPDEAHLPVGQGAPPAPDANPVQQVIKVRRDYNAWVARET